MNPYVILCIDGDPIIIERLNRDLAAFGHEFDIIGLESTEDARDALDYLESQSQRVAILLCNNTLDNDKGVELLVDVDNHPASKGARTILLSDSPQYDTILHAVNEGRLNYCLTKPWRHNELQDVVKKELTLYVLSQNQDDLLRYSNVLEHRMLLDAHIEKRLQQYRSDFLSGQGGQNTEQLSRQVIEGLYDFFEGNDESRACRKYSADHLLTQEGQPNSYLWFIIEGDVALLKQDEHGKQHQVSVLTDGSLIGGMSFVTGDVSFSTSITLTPATVIKINRELFNKVMQSRGELLPKFTQFLLLHFNSRLKGSINTELKLQQTLKSLDDANQQLLHKEKMAMLGQLVAGVAHELNNPVSAILRNSEALVEQLGFACQSSLSDRNKQKAIALMDRARLSKPLSTSEARQRAKTLAAITTDRQLARLLVNLGLDTQDEQEQWLEPLGSSLPDVVTEWSHFAQCGGLLRSNQVCAQRIADMVKSLKTYARKDDEQYACADIHEGVEDTLVMFEHQLKQHQVIKEYSEVPHLRCKPFALQQVWTNLVSNALDAMTTPGTLTVETGITHYQEKTAVQVCFTDSGKGITNEQKNNIFELNYTTKKEGNFGLGIGLAVCRQIVLQHGGDILVESVPNEFTKMTVILPIGTPLQHKEVTP